MNPLMDRKVVRVVFFFGMAAMVAEVTGRTPHPQPLDAACRSADVAEF